MMLTALFRVVLPQLIVRWLPVIAAMTLGLGLALAVGNASETGSSTEWLAIIIFGVVALLTEAVGDRVTGRFVKMPDEISLQLRDRRGVVLSARAVDWILSTGHVVMGIALIVLMFRLFSGCNC